MIMLPEKPYDSIVRTYNIKDEVDMIDFLYIPVLLQLMFLDVVQYCDDHGLMKPTITRILDEKIPGVSTTNIHATGRAMDIRSRVYRPNEIQDIINHITMKYRDVGAIGELSGKPTPILYENGIGGPHFHLQVRP